MNATTHEWWTNGRGNQHLFAGPMVEGATARAQCGKVLKELKRPGANPYCDRCLKIKKDLEKYEKAMQEKVNQS